MGQLTNKMMGKGVELVGVMEEGIHSNGAEIGAEKYGCGNKLKEGMRIRGWGIG